MSDAANCKCGHGKALHHHGKDCTAITDEAKLKYCRCQEFKCQEFRGSEKTESNQTVEGESMSNKARVAKVAKVRTLLVVRYEPTAKDGKELLAKDNTSQAAAMYRALASAKEPLTIKETYAACEGKMESTAAWERLGKNKNSTLFALRNGGYVKKTERREEQEPKAARAAKKPKAARKARVRKPAGDVAGNTAATEQAAEAAA